MRALLFLSMFAGMGALFVIKVRDLRKDTTSPYLRALCVAIVLSGTGSLIGVPTVLTFLETSSGVPAVWLLATLVAACAAVQVPVTLWSLPAEQARAALKVRLIAYTLTILAIVVLTYRSRNFVTTQQIRAHQQAPEFMWATTPYLRDAYLLYFVALIISYAAAAVQCWRMAKIVDRRWLQRCLSTWVVGCLVFQVYLVATAGYCVALRVGAHLSSLPSWPVGAAAAGVLILGAGTTLPTLGPQFDRIRAYRRLEPLWRELRQASPGVVLDPAWSVRLDSWNLRHLNFRLYRRVIEIRDVALAMKPYFQAQVETRVRQLAADTGCSPTQLETTIEAAQLAVAVRARRAGRAPAARSWNPPSVGGGLDAEVSVLVPLARTFATSPIVRAVAVDERLYRGEQTEDTVASSALPQQ